MSSYHETCPKCEDETITHGWSPVKCPFCEIEELRKQRDMLAEALTELLDALGATRKPHELIGYGIAEHRAQEIAALAAVKGGEA